MIALVGVLIVWSAMVFVNFVYLAHPPSGCMLQRVPTIVGQPVPTPRTPAEDAEYYREHCEPSPYVPFIVLGVGYALIVGVAVSGARSR